MVAHQHGSVWNGSRIASSLGIAHTTSRRYLDLLAGAFIVRQLAPWYVNVGKRLVKSPKVYIRDAGLLHELLGIRTHVELESHPVLGASWEGLAVEEILWRARDREAFFYGTYAGAEIDLLVTDGSRRIGFEMKVSESPRPTKSMRTAQRDLALDHLYIVYPGDKSFPIDDNLSVLSLNNIAEINPFPGI
jgi:predicted AAA+ superfamily ATPase